MRRFVIVFFLAVIFALPVAADEVYSAEDFDIAGITDSLPDEVLEYLPDDIFDPSAASRTGVGFFANVGAKLLKTALSPALMSFSKPTAAARSTEMPTSIRS